MKKQLCWIVLCTAFVMTFCSNPKSEIATEPESAPKAPQLFIKTAIAPGASVQQSTDATLNKVDSYYFEIGFYEKKNEPGIFSAKDQGGLYEVVQQDGSEATFKGPDEFLAFMSERGYEKADRLELKYHTEYTFRKKK